MPSQTKSEPFTVKKILVPTDFSEASNIAFNYALLFRHSSSARNYASFSSWAGQSRRNFLECLKRRRSPRRNCASVEKKLKVWSDSAGAMGLSAKLILRNGLAAHEIVQTAKGMDADLVIYRHARSLRIKTFGHRQHRGARRAAAPCPVLVVREKQHGFI